MSEKSDIHSGLCGIVQAIENSFQGETSSHYESNVPLAITEVAKAIYRLGNADAATPMGGLEALGKVFLDCSEQISGAINNLADAVREVGSAIAEDEPLNFGISRGLSKIAERT